MIQIPELKKLIQLYGLSACRESLIILADHLNNSVNYESIDEFLRKLTDVITFEFRPDSSIIDPDLAYKVTQKLTKVNKLATDENHVVDVENIETSPPTEVLVNIKNVQYEPIKKNKDETKQSSTGDLASVLKKYKDKFDRNHFDVHYNYLYNKLTALPIFSGDVKLVKLNTLTASSQPSIRCVCMGLLIKDTSKIDLYSLIDSSCTVPVKITPETKFRNRLAYANCIFIVEGVYINPDDILFAANIGLPPVLLDPIPNKALACSSDKLTIIVKEPFLDDEDVCEALQMLFNGYNSLEEPPLLFILIGNFTREPCDIEQFRTHMKKLVRFIKDCDKLKESHFVLIPGLNDTTPKADNCSQQEYQLASKRLPKPPLTKKHLPINLLDLAQFKNVHLATNPSHIYVGDRLVTVVSQPYLKQLRKNLLHDMTDHSEELFQTVEKLVLSNGHLTAGVSQLFHSSMNLWHRPDLFILADTEAFGNRYDYSSSKESDTTFATMPSFAKQSYQFRVYYVKSGEIEDSQVSLDGNQDDDEEEEEEQPPPDGAPEGESETLPEVMDIIDD